MEDSTTGKLDRKELLKRAGAAAVIASVPLEKTSGAWAGLTKPAATKPLRIGNLLTLSGPNAAAPIDVKKGFVTYVKSRGGRIGGRKIQFFDADDAQNPATAIQQAQKLVQESNVDVIEGIFYSNILLAVRDTLDSLKVPTVVANAAANAITRERKSDYMFRTSYTNYMLGAPMGKWAAKKLPSGMVTMIANYAAGQESSAAFRAAYEAAGGKLVGDNVVVPFPVVADYQPFVSQIMDRNPRAVWAFTGSGAESIKFVKACKQFGLLNRAQLIGNNNLTDPQAVLDGIGNDGVGIRTSCTWAPTLKNSENQRFIKAYRQFGGVPSPFAELGYVAAQYLDMALRKVHGDTSNKDRLLKAMANPGTFVSPGGRVRMDASTHQMAVPFYVQQVVKKGNGYTEKLIGNLGVIHDPGK